MLKVIPISAVLLLSFGSAFAQNSQDNPDSNVTDTTLTTPASSPATSTPDTTNSAAPDATDTTATTPDPTASGAAGISTDTTTNTTTTAPISTTVTPTAVGTTGSAPSDTTASGSSNSLSGPTMTGDTSGTNNPTQAPTAPSTTVTSSMPANSFTCVGNAPTWNLSVSKDLITYSSAKDPNVKLKMVTPLTPTGDTSGNLLVFSAKQASGKPVNILVRKNDAGCNNGLSGQSYQYDAYIVFPNLVVVGCCNPL